MVSPILLGGLLLAFGLPIETELGQNELDSTNELFSSIFEAFSGSIPFDDQEELEIFPSRNEIIDSDKSQSTLTKDALSTWAHRLWLAANESTLDEGHPTRFIGTKGHNASLQSIIDTLDELNDTFTYELQPFVALAGRIHNWTSSTADGNLIESKPLQLSPAVDPVSAPIHIVDNFGCLPSDYTATPDQRGDHTSDGKIVLVKRGECPFGDKAEFAGLANAVAVLMWDPELDSDSIMSGDLSTPMPHQVATLGISGKMAMSLKEHQYVTINVDAEILQIPTMNVIAETKSGAHDNVVFAGAHSDSVIAGPGINDNGSGMLTLLEIAKQLSHFKMNNAIRSAWWSAEELGLKGSLHYTENSTGADAKKIRLFLDYDMLASRNYIYEIYDSDDSENPKGSSALRDMFVGWYEDHGYNYTLQPFDGRSDYVGFVEIGIPSSGVDSGVEELKTEEQVAEFGGEAGVAYDDCYHQACDSLDNVSLEPWLVNAQIVAHSVAVYAKDLSAFPKRDNAYYEQRISKPRRWPDDVSI